MKNYIKLTVDAQAFWSGNTYYEEVFLPEEVWEEIKENFRTSVYLHGFDGKHSEVKAEVEVEECNSEYLKAYKPTDNNDGDNLFDHIYEYLDEDKYDNSYLWNIQEEVMNLSQAEYLTIKINKDKKDEVMSLLKEYLI